ncbi:hypothetical protein [Chryseobacterium sp.]|uniref:hypothetical protein n=1 Tax=Chryseobacterium sp. TaxID=1871047 RepID=UPI0012C25422|nr:hypothetical protein [Chryseobacterium sp.]MPS65933.1 hypothetical protein [Chryseobacterium sp.]
MTPEQFIPQNYFPLGSYPCPNLINPHIDQMKKDMDSWIDHDYAYLPESARKKYKKNGIPSMYGKNGSQGKL